MKKIILAVAMLATLGLHAQSDKYNEAMKKNLLLMDSAKTADDFTAAANGFERIGDAEKTQWLPYYYAALTLAINGWHNPAIDKDANATRIKALCDKAAAINDNAEIYVVRNMAATQQMLVDAQSRWQTYGQEAAGYLQKGMQLDPNNGRLYYLQGASVFNTPEQFGGGHDKAKPILEKALQLLNAENPQPLYPHWGKEQAQQMLDQANAK